MKRRGHIADERGDTLIELMVGLAAGLVVLATLTMVILVTLEGSAKVSARVDATQRARVVLDEIIEELHSACVAPKIAPIYAKSTGTSLEFIHAAGTEGSQVAPNPTLSVISLSKGVLSQSNSVATGGTAGAWTWSAPTTTQLMTNIAPIAPSSSIFSYYAYSNGALSETPLKTPLEANAALTIEVRIALTATPGNTPVTDGGAAASIQGSAELRLTPPSFNEQAVSLPCQ